MHKFILGLILSCATLTPSLHAQPSNAIKPESQFQSQAIECLQEHLLVELYENILCVQGLDESFMRQIREADPFPRLLQWNAYEFLKSDIDPRIKKMWPTGVSSIRISQGQVPPPKTTLQQSDIDSVLVDKQRNLVYYYPQNISFRDKKIRVRCTATTLPVNRQVYVEMCAMSVGLPKNLVLTADIFTKIFYDGGPGWPTFYENYQPASWQDSLNELSQFLDLVVLSKVEK